MIRKTTKAILLTMICTFLLAEPALAASKTIKVKVTLVSVELVENNHVGNEWLTVGYVNGKEIDEGSTVTLNLKATDSVKIQAFAEEQDKIPDISEKSTTVKVSSIKSPENKTLKVTVVENRGRYSGNTAEWKFVYKIEK